MRARKDKLQGTLDLLVLRTLARGEPLHGYAITTRISACSADALQVEEGSLYPALHRMEEARWLQSEWRVSDNNRRARYYRITPTGRRQLNVLDHEWAEHVSAVQRVLRLA